MPSEFILSGAIQSEPVGTLAECLQFSDVISLALVHKLTDDCGDENPDEWDDPEKRESLIPGLLKVIPESFEKNIRWLQREDTTLIGETVRLMAEAACFPDELTPCFHFLENMGYIYLFAQDGQLWPVLPDELSAIWKKVMADRALTEELMFNQELCEYAIALAKLYGAYETEQLAEVWNRHHTNKITVELAGQLLGETENFQEQYWLSDGLVISELVFDYEELDELFENMKDTPYYMPTKSVIAQYADDDRGPFDENRPELKSMMEFLKTAVPDDAPSRDDLDYDIVFACTEEWTGADVAEMLLQYDFPLGDSDAVETFTRLYQSLFENTRLWTLRGDTPANYAKATGSRLIPFSLPSLVPRKSKKTGRNAPCPCGSGKKYKRCCGA